MFFSPQTNITDHAIPSTERISQSEADVEPAVLREKWSSLESQLDSAKWTLLLQ